MEAIGWILALLLGLVLGAAWVILLLELVGIPIAAAVAGIGGYLKHRREHGPEGSSPESSRTES